MRARSLALILALVASPICAEEPKRISSFSWETDLEHFGGYSGLAIRDGGTRFTAISDRGAFTTGRLIRTGSAITGVEIDRHAIMQDHNGVERPKSFHRDAEGLDIDPSGRIHVSYEGYHRIATFSDLAKKPDVIHFWKLFWDLQRNSGMEALARTPAGQLIAIPERSGQLDRPFPIFRYLGNKKWDLSGTWSIPRRGVFLVVGADLGPDGRLYVLERDFSWWRGFSTRIRRFEFGPDGPVGEETLLETGFSTHDNLEGISVWQDAAGHIVMTMISDDNFNALQRTQFVEYRLPKPEKQEAG